MPKNIVIFSDGTGQDGGIGHNTNVYKLFNMIEDRTPDQISFYDPGLGTDWRKITGNVTGMGISRNIIDCYKFLFYNYQAGDQIFLFGFSRGATTVRSLSSFIHLFGILPRSRAKLIKKAFKIYKIADDEVRRNAAKTFVIRHHIMWARVKFLGVWDTVMALGLPFKGVDVFLNQIKTFKHKFHDLRLSESVENGYHALALDDERLTFHPTLWDTKLYPHQTTKQVWFCGMHTDIGGGYQKHGLSDIALEWMILQAQKHGLLIYPEHGIELKPRADGHMHNSRGGRLTQFYRRKTRTWNAETHGKPVVHESVLQRTLNRQNLNDPPYQPWIFNFDYDVEPWERLA